MSPTARSRSTNPHQMRIIAALGIVYVVWGSTYLAIDMAITAVPPMALMAVRFLVAGGLLYAWAVRQGDRHGDRPTLRQWGQATVTGGVLLLGGTGLVAMSLTMISSGTAALLAATVPVWMALLGRLLFGDALSPRAMIGLILGLVGVAILVEPSGGQIGGVLLALSGAFAWAAGSLRSRQVDAPSRPMVAAAMEMLGASVLFAVVSVLSGELRRFDAAAIDATTVGAFVYLVTAGSIVAFGAYRWLVLNVTPTLVGTHAYINPVVAVVLAWLVLGERIDARMAVAGAIVLVSLVLLVTGRPGVPIPAQATSGGDVYAGVRRWHRIRTVGRTVSRAPAVAWRVGVAPVARGYRAARSVRDAKRGHSDLRNVPLRPQDTI